MPLPETVIPIIANQGIDTKTNDKLVTNKFIAVDNCVFPAGTPTKRNGYTSFSNVNLGDGKALLKFKRELLNFGNGKARSYAEPLDDWIDKGNYLALSIDVDSILKNENILYNPTSDINNSVVVTAWDEVQPTISTADGSLSVTNKGIRASVFTEKSETYYIADSLISSSGKHAQCIAINSYNYIFYTEGTNLRWQRVGNGNPTNLVKDTDNSGPGAVFTDLHSDGIYRIKKFFNGLLCVYKKTTGQIGVQYINSEGAAGTVLNNFFAPKTITEAIDTDLELFTIQTPEEIIAYIVFKDTSNNLKFVTATFSLSLSSALAADTETRTNLRNMIFVSKKAGELEMYFDIVDSTAHRNNLIRKQTLVSGTANSVESTVFKRGLSLASQSFSQDNRNFFVVQFLDVIQSKFFLLDDEGCTFGAFAGPAQAGEVPIYSIVGKHPGALPTFSKDGNKAIGIMPFRGDFRFANTVRYFKQGISAVTIDFENYTYTADELADNALISGGLTYLYDGAKLTEFGFNYFPETIARSATGSLEDAGMVGGIQLYYNFIFTYTWTDNQGKAHRSRSSFGTNNFQNQYIDGTFTVPTLRLTEKDDVVVEMWRTAANGSLYYRVAEVPNDPTVDTISIRSVITNTNLTKQFQLPVTSGVLEAGPLQSSRIIKTHKNRIFAAGLANRNEIAYSKQIFTGQTVEFAPEFTLQLDPTGGDITGLESLEDWLVIFKANDIFILSGNGPTNLGTGNAYQPPRRIAGDIGCIDPNSIEIIPEGIMFKSAKGIYVLNRELRPVYLGADVEAFNSFTVTSAKVVDDANEIRFSTLGTKEINGTVYTNPILTYNYFYKIWSVFTKLSAVDSEIFEGDYVYLQADGTVKRETKGIYKDDGSDVNINITTAWIKLGQLQGFQRVRDIFFLGEYKSKHYLKIFIKYDYKDEEGSRYYYFPDGNIARDIPANYDSFFGDDEEFGDSSVFGGDDDGVYEFSLKPDTQKCEAIQITVSDAVDNSVAGGGQSFDLTALNLRVAQKVGMNKINRKKKVATH